jgi:hypothetical protein
LYNKNRVNREIYARFREKLGVKFPGPTRHHDGFAVWAKRLEEGSFATGAVLSGIDLQQAAKRKRYRRDAA